MQIPSEIKSLFKDTFNLTAVSIGVLSGIGQLLQFSAGAGRLIMRLIIVGCCLFVAIRVWFVYFRARILQLHSSLDGLKEQLAQEAADHREQLARQEAEHHGQLAQQEIEHEAHQQKLNGQLTRQQVDHRKYVDAIKTISDRESPYFNETLELTIVIGTDDSGDKIIEKRHTKPNPRVTHTTMRPIVTTGTRVGLDDISFQARISGAAGSITALPLQEDAGLLRVWLVFEPAMTGPTSWEVKYRPRGLWGPLRERRRDVLKWDDRRPRADGAPSALTDFTVRFVFPESERQPSVTEHNGLGICKAPEKNGTGGWEIVWRDAHPIGRIYFWDLAQPPG